MKVIKPQRLGVLTRTFEIRRRCYFSVGVLAFFPFEQPDALLPEFALWKFLAMELGPEAALDLGMPKPGGEVLVYGKACQPGGVARAACQVRVRFGAIDKTLYVVGDRRWESGAMTSPEPFVEMPVTWDRAFGGEGYPQNPVGKGFNAKEGAPLPNVELPSRMIRGIADRPPAVGLTAMDPMWPQRASKAGTYDDAWLASDFPGLARDIDMTYFNAAPEDQRFGDCLRGDETFGVEGMHPEHPALEGRLPRAKAKIFVTRSTPEGERFIELSARPETAWLFPHAKRGVVLYRGVTEVTEDDADDVVHLVIAAEAPDAPRDEAHYRGVLARRLDREKGGAFTLRDDELLPPRPADARVLSDEAPSEIELLGGKAGLLRQRLRRRAELQLEQTRKQLNGMGIDADKYVPKQLPPEPPPPTAEQLPEVMDQAKALMAQARLDGEAQRVDAMASARALCEKHGIDFTAALEKARKKQGGPPKFTAAGELERMRGIQSRARLIGMPTPELDAKIEDPELHKKLTFAESKMREMYRRYAQAFPAAERLEGEEDTSRRGEVLRALEAGESLAGWDLTGADLSGLDLRGRDLRGTCMEAADLHGSDLTGADLTQAVFTRADLTGATLEDVRASEANFAESVLRSVLFARADLARVVMVKADVFDANFDGATLTEANFSEARFSSVSLRGVKAAQSNFSKTDLSRAICKGADFSKGRFQETVMDGADLTEVTLSSATFYRARAERVSFAGAVMNNVRVVEECSFRGSDFDGAHLEAANLRGANLEGATLRSAVLTGSELSKCNLRGADFSRAVLRGARMVRADLTGANLRSADLMEADLQKSLLHGADLRGSRMFRADLGRARWDTETHFTGAMLLRVRRVAP